MAKDEKYPAETYPDTHGGDPEVLRRYYGALDEFRQSLASAIPLPIEYLVAKLTTTGEVNLRDYKAELRQVEAEKEEIAARPAPSEEEAALIAEAERSFNGIVPSDEAEEKAPEEKKAEEKDEEKK